jgi:hypothetical protein
VAEDLEAALVGVEAQVAHVHELAVGEVHRIGEEGVEQLGLELEAGGSVSCLPTTARLGRIGPIRSQERSLQSETGSAS